MIASMRPLSSLPILCSLLMAAACGGDPNEANEDNVRAALQTMLDENNSTCLAIGKPNQPFPGNYAFDWRSKTSGALEQLKPLVAAGVITWKDVQMKPPMSDSGSTKLVDGVEIGLTEEGRQFYREIERSYMMSGKGMFGALCAGRAVVESVENFTIPAVGSASPMLEVRYTYRLEEVPAWATDEAVQAAIPALKNILKASAEPVEDKTALILTQRGWSHKL